MNITYGEKETFINLVFVHGQVIGMFKSHVHYSRLGSKRALVEQIFNKYEGESSIEIITQSINSIPEIHED